MKPFSQAAENNKTPILAVLRDYLTVPGDLLEIGAGTGQHAVWLAPYFPDVRWTPSEQPENLDGLAQWLAQAPGDNLTDPLALNVEGDWPEQAYRYIFTANTFHILSRPQVEHCIHRVCEQLLPGGRFLVYGPFNYRGTYTSDSNRQFDLSLKARDIAMGIRDQEWVVRRFAEHGRELLGDHEMPANNRVLVFG
ncbi:MAG TPA: DUF938 domain-containing protein [Alcanivorax sp.]|nr:DUF938 domain-containing protein [Alcanivorax sp.]